MVFFSFFRYIKKFIKQISLVIFLSELWLTLSHFSHFLHFINLNEEEKNMTIPFSCLLAILNQSVENS